MGSLSLTSTSRREEWRTPRLFRSIEIPVERINHDQVGMGLWRFSKSPYYTTMLVVVICNVHGRVMAWDFWA